MVMHPNLIQESQISKQRKRTKEERKNKSLQAVEEKQISMKLRIKNRASNKQENE